VIGRPARAHLAELQEIARHGHIVGNHTDSHPGLVQLLREGGHPIEELLPAEAVLRSCDNNPIRFFRVPYGSWRDSPPDSGIPTHSVVARRLNASRALSEYVGHIH